MPHYRDGTEVKLGDIAKGKGYNVKNDAGELKEIVGAVVGITPDSKSCNIQIAHVVTHEMPDAAPPDYRFYTQTCVIGCGANGGASGTPKVAATARLEYGQCDAFELVHRG